ncbi:hypothetical protein OUZ56_001697 [Daphnia magna]|uniref:Uncharacterized protein n=1 Tax=Daphnia magna TaxID=35525 RepID=A0ABR0A3F6_9CRUS|nr:hypothetical protein OUZ56_001697 [Daphnia magna]
MAVTGVAYDIREPKSRTVSSADVYVVHMFPPATADRLTNQGESILNRTKSSQCDSGAGVDAFFHAIYTTKDFSSSSSSSTKTKSKPTTSVGRPFVMLLGPHCSHVTESVASVTSYWNIVQYTKSNIGENNLCQLLFIRIRRIDPPHMLSLSN